MASDEAQYLLRRFAQAFAIQAVQIKALHRAVRDLGVSGPQLLAYVHAEREASYQREVRRFAKHLLGRFAGQVRTASEELDELEAMWDDDEPADPQTDGP